MTMDGYSRFTPSNYPVSQTQLFSPSLQALSQHTYDNLARLNAKLQRQEYQRLTREKRQHQGYNSSDALSVSSQYETNDDDEGMYTDDDDNSSIYSTGTVARNFCNMCSSQQEHDQCHRPVFHSQRWPRKKPRAQIAYIAPLPAMRKLPTDQGRPPSVVCRDALYRVAVHTGDRVNAGTSATVSLTIKGTDDNLSRTELHKAYGSKFSFGRGTEEVFYLHGPVLGKIRYIVVEHDGLLKQHGWYLDRIEITDMETDQMWIFTCQDWLSLHHSDFRIKREIRALEKQVKRTDYQISVITGKRMLAGTDAHVFITLYGSKGKTHRHELRTKSDRKKSFERGSVDNFTVWMNSVGDLKKIRIEHDGKGVAPGWFLEKVIITDTKQSKKVYFMCCDWLSGSEGSGKLWKELSAQSRPDFNAPQLEYQISVMTGNVTFGGTDANVFIQLCGNLGTTDRIKLDDAKNNFECKMTDLFKIKAPDVGPLKKIIIGHDNSGAGPGWFLDKVIVRRYLSDKDMENEVRRRSKVAERRMSRNSAAVIKQAEGGLDCVDAYIDDNGLLDSNSEFKDLEREILLEFQEGLKIRREWDKKHRVQFRTKHTVFKQHDDVDGYYNQESETDESDSDDSQIAHDEVELRNKAKSKQIMEKSRQKTKVPIFEEYTFVCNRWLADNEDDKKIVRELKYSEKMVHHQER